VNNEVKVLNDWLNDIFHKKLRGFEPNTSYYDNVPTIDSAIKEMVAYANTNGGCLIWGMETEPDVKIIGLANDVLLDERVSHICKQLPDTLNYCFYKFNVGEKQLVGVLIFKAQKTILVHGVKYTMQNRKPMPETPIIFISHSSKDKKKGLAFVELLEELGVPSSSIIFTSEDRFGIPVGQNIFDYLKNEIHENTHMIYLLSENYFDSPACLNEMGASWITGNDFTYIAVPEFNFASSKFAGIAIDNHRIGFEMNNRDRMFEFRNIIHKKFALSPIDERRWYSLWDKYTQKLL